MKLCLLFLTCANVAEADAISKSLLEKRLVACIKASPVSSSFLWEGKIQKSNEILLIMDSIEENFEKVKTEVAKLHSYDTFVLVATPVSHATNEVMKWMHTEMGVS